MSTATGLYTLFTWELFRLYRPSQVRMFGDVAEALALCVGVELDTGWLNGLSMVCLIYK